VPQTLPLTVSVGYLGEPLTIDVYVAVSGGGVSGYADVTATWNSGVNSTVTEKLRIWSGSNGVPGTPGVVWSLPVKGQTLQVEVDGSGSGMTGLVLIMGTSRNIDRAEVRQQEIPGSQPLVAYNAESVAGATHIIGYAQPCSESIRAHVFTTATGWNFSVYGMLDVGSTPTLVELFAASETANRADLDLSSVGGIPLYIDVRNNGSSAANVTMIVTGG
jgi:hypothetical protein